jgi:dolichol-phosphate mannosyltransferase
MVLSNASARRSEGMESSCAVSIIVPTINEGDNLPALVKRISTSMTGYHYEVLIIDDGSVDDTADVCRRLGHLYPLVLHTRSAPVGGLSGAVLYGFARARGEILVVMDADLQHPPEALPRVITPLIAGECDIAVGSRRAPGARVSAQWGPLRRINSEIARLLAAPLAGSIRDPMSGFFALRRATWRDGADIDPLGYKICLELICKCPVQRILEIPIEFAERAHGHSKLTILQQFHYIRHLRRLYTFCCIRHARCIIEKLLDIASRVDKIGRELCLGLSRRSEEIRMQAELFHEIPIDTDQAQQAPWTVGGGTQVGQNKLA